MNNQAQKHKVQPAEVSREELEELKRDMRTAHLAAWVGEHQQSLIIAAAAVLIVMAGAGLWRDHVVTQRTSAAALYHQALNTADAQAKRSLLEKVVKDYQATAYGGLAQLLLARVDRQQSVHHLQALLSHSGLDREIGWQAELDLASAWLRRNDKLHAREALTTRVGRDYEQLRQYLLARAADSDAERLAHLEKASAAVSHDTVLKQRIERELARIRLSSAAASTGNRKAIAEK